MEIEKLKHTMVDYPHGIGWSVSTDDIIDKVNEVIDALDQLLALHKIDYKEDEK